MIHDCLGDVQLAGPFDMAGMERDPLEIKLEAPSELQLKKKSKGYFQRSPMSKRPARHIPRMLIVNSHLALCPSTSVAT